MRLILVAMACSFVAPAAWAEPPAIAPAADEGVTTTVRCAGATAPPAPSATTNLAPPTSPPLLVWTERKVSTPLPGMWGAGLGVWVAAYATGAIAGTTSNNPFGWWPILGAFAATGLSRDLAQGLWALDGAVQVGGFVVFLVGLAAGPSRIERVPVFIGYAALDAGGRGLVATLRF